MAQRKGAGAGGDDPKNVHNTAPRSRKNRHTSSTSHRGSASLAVYDGQTLVSSITERGGRHLAHDRDGGLVGDFASRVEAMHSFHGGGTP